MKNDIGANCCRKRISRSCPFLSVTLHAIFSLLAKSYSATARVSRRGCVNAVLWHDLLSDGHYDVYGFASL